MTASRPPIFTYTIKDKKGADLTGTNTMFEGAEIRPVKNGDEYEVNFRQKMTLQGGEYLLSMSFVPALSRANTPCTIVCMMWRTSRSFPIRIPWVFMIWNPRWRQC